jgi:hypothetical protein
LIFSILADVSRIFRSLPMFHLQTLTQVKYFPYSVCLLYPIIFIVQDYEKLPMQTPTHSFSANKPHHILYLSFASIRRPKQCIRGASEQVCAALCCCSCSLPPPWPLASHYLHYRCHQYAGHAQVVARAEERRR